MTFDLIIGLILYNLKTKHRRCIKLYIFFEFGIFMTRQTIYTIFREIGACFNFWPMWNSQGQWWPSWKCHNMWHIRKMLLMLNIYTPYQISHFQQILHNNTTFGCLAALLSQETLEMQILLSFKINFKKDLKLYIIVLKIVYYHAQPNSQKLMFLLL